MLLKRISGFVGLLLGAVLFFFGSPLHAQPAGTDPAFARAQHLRRGINASIWFAQHPSDYSVERLRTFTTADDIALIAKLGFDHVRLSIDADPLVEWQRTHGSATPFMTELDRVVKTLHHRGPDGEGHFTHRDVDLVHTRLAILDTSSAASQPMVDALTGRTLKGGLDTVPLETLDAFPFAVFHNLAGSV